MIARLTTLLKHDTVYPSTNTVRYSTTIHKPPRKTFQGYRLKTTLKSRLPAFLCALVLLLCALASYPFAEIGMGDDFSYIKTAQVLAQTGHIVYNGWATAMLGWQLVLGAVFAKLFGASFTAVRLSILPVALVTAFLLQRTLVRMGIGSRNATIGVLALVLSPLYLSLSAVFLSDAAGFFCIVLCLYACLRALQAESDRTVLGWLAIASLSNAVGGTVRQIAWLGVLVAFPCTVWLLRRRPRVVVVGALLYVVSLAIVFGSMQWFKHQPYSVPEPLVPEKLDVVNIFRQFEHVFQNLATYLLPVLVAFVGALSLRNLRTRVVSCAGALLFLATALFLHHRHKLVNLFVPFNADDRWSNAHSLYYRLALTAVVYLVLLGLLAFLLNIGRLPARQAENEEGISWRSLLVLLVPFTLAYLALLLPRASGGHPVFDRYLVPLLFLAIVLLVRVFQERVQPNLPAISVVLIAIFACYAVADMHDVFSAARARLAAVNELQAAGVPATSIDGGLEYDGMVQIDRYGHLNDPRIQVPVHTYNDQFASFPKDCQPFERYLFPAIVPGYTLTSNPVACGGDSGFAPVSYSSWLGPYPAEVYIVKTVGTTPEQH
jgi:hypothetical protein